MFDPRVQLQVDLEKALDEAFARYRLDALWSKRRPQVATPLGARQIAYSLRREGPLASRRLAERIEELSNAIDRLSTAGVWHNRAQSRS
jgi:hypothetical protein